MNFFHKRTAFTLVILIIFCSILIENQAVVSLNRVYWPTEEWQYTSPEEQQIDSTILTNMVEYLDEESIFVDSILIARHGFVVFEDYFIGSSPEYKHVLWSVTKSFISALVGIALDKGYLESTNQKALDFFPNITFYNPDPRKSNITIENLLTMSTGLEWTDEVNYFPMVTSNNQIEYAFSRPMIQDPGAVWNYDTGGTHILSAIIEEATGNSTLEFAKEHLFDPIGISNYTWSQDKQGYYFGGFGIYMTARDMARFGYLYLNNGTWDGKQIISSDWIENSTKPSWSLTADGALSYGYLWWLRPNLGFYGAKGRYSQMIYVIPKYDIVVTFTSNIEPGTYDTDYLIENYVIPAVEDFSESVKISFGIPFIIVFMFIVNSRLRKKKKNEIVH
ncbi:MAG: serine hydrolase [Candidatus Heimdallarchaeota archaeon]